jgi:hypothetical protein
MDDAARAREAARDALADVEPSRLRAVIDERLREGAVTPGALTLVCARLVCRRAGSGAPDPASDAVCERAAGVQLVYEGLALTRRLAHDEPWARTDAIDVEADLEIVAADVLVSRGFSLLARTAAATRAVEVVRAFGRDQTDRETAADPAALDRELEADVLALAAVAGATVVDPPADPALVEYAAGLGRDLSDGGAGFPAAAHALGGPVRDRLAALAGGPVEGVDDEPAPRSATDP